LISMIGNSTGDTTEGGGGGAHGCGVKAVGAA